MENIKRVDSAVKDWKKFCINQHDIEVNQKYGETLPYSFHLICVVSQSGVNRKPLNGSLDKIIITLACWGHDLEEDARMTHNDIREKLFEIFVRNELVTILNVPIRDISKEVANIIHCVTDEKGKNRGERKNNKYYAELKANKYAVFVKLADLAANTLFSKLSGSSMYDKYKKEWPKFKEKVYIEEYNEFFDYVENL